MVALLEQAFGPRHKVVAEVKKGKSDQYNGNLSPWQSNGEFQSVFLRSHAFETHASKYKNATLGENYGGAPMNMLLAAAG